MQQLVGWKRVRHNFVTEQQVLPSGKGQRYRGALQHELSWPLCGAPVNCSPATSISSPLRSGSLSFAQICLFENSQQTLPASLPLLLGHLPAGLGERNSNPIHLLRLAYQISHLRGKADLSSSTCRLKAPRLVRESRSRGQRSRKERPRRAQHSKSRM